MMRVILNRPAVLAALVLLSSVVRKISPKPVLTGVKLSAKDRALNVAGTDLELSMEIAVTEVQIEQVGETIVNLDELLATLKASDSEVAIIESRKDTDVRANYLHVVDHDGAFDLPELEVDQFPNLPGGIGPVKCEGFSVPIDMLIKAINHVAWSAERKAGN